jgi:DNA-directed RNA polymerase I subunit RPA1
VYNSNKLAIKEGLYDPGMGVSPNRRDGVCVSCGQVGMKCSGHAGHIELLLPVYNPIIIDMLLKLLRMNCFNCHRFRIKKSIKEDFEVIFGLVKIGLVNEAKYFWENDVERWEKKIKRLEREKIKDDEREKELKK